MRTATATDNDNSVQYETEPTVGTTQEDSLRIVKKSGSMTPVQVETSPRHKTFSTMKKLFAVLKIRGQRYIDHLIKQQYKNTFDDSDSLNSENIDVLTTQGRKAELERIERFRTNGM